MSRVFGMDLSSKKLAIVLLDDDFPTGWIYEVPKKEKNRASILAYFIEELESLFSEMMLSEDDFVFVEHPVVGRGGAHATIVQAQVQGVALGTSVLCGAGGAYPVNVQTWKKDVIGHGGADKDRVREWLSIHHPVLAEMAGDDQDLVDASCVALYGREVIRRGSQLLGG